MLKSKIYLYAILLAAIIVRYLFYVGHVFSDDAYYSFLSYTLFKGNFPGHYLGYPVFPLRIGQIGLTALAFGIFGINEFATVFFPFIFSILSIVLIFYFTKSIAGNNSTAVIASFLAAFFPVDIIFSTIDFPDLINAFFIYLGLFLLWRASYSKKYFLAVFSGISLYISFLFKENLYYVLILLVIIWIYLAIKKYPSRNFILCALFVVTLFIIGECLFYLAGKGQFFYRLKVIQTNYKYSYYDFYPYTVYKMLRHKAGELYSLFYQIFIINFRSIFLRRFYLLLPLLAVISSVINFIKRKHLLLSFWYIGLAVLLIGFTTSFTMYKPLDLHRSWYVYPLIMPVIILSAILINNFKTYIKYAAVSLYLIFSLIMCNKYLNYFGTADLNKFKSFIRTQNSKIIYTDFFTKYSVDLLLNYKGEKNRRVILGSGFNLKSLKMGDLLIYDKNHIEELKLQKYSMPDFSHLDSAGFKLVNSFGQFKIYEKI